MLHGATSVVCACFPQRTAPHTRSVSVLLARRYSTACESVFGAHADETLEAKLDEASARLDTGDAAASAAAALSALVTGTEGGGPTAGGGGGDSVVSLHIVLRATATIGDSLVRQQRYTAAERVLEAALALWRYVAGGQPPLVHEVAPPSVPTRSLLCADL